MACAWSKGSQKSRVGLFYPRARIGNLYCGGCRSYGGLSVQFAFSFESIGWSYRWSCGLHWGQLHLFDKFLMSYFVHLLTIYQSVSHPFICFVIQSEFLLQPACWLKLQMETFHSSSPQFQIFSSYKSCVWMHHLASSRRLSSLIDSNLYFVGSTLILDYPYLL